MSGGSYDYIYSRLEEECAGRMYDAEMDDMIKDLCQVLHNLEWWQSSDYSENEYRATLDEFKEKWFKGNREERLKGYVDNQIGILRKNLYALIGEPMAEGKHSTIEELEQKPTPIKASDIQPDDEWMQEDEWDEIYKQEDDLPDINVGKIKESEELK